MVVFAHKPTANIRLTQGVNLSLFVLFLVLLITSDTLLQEAQGALPLGMSFLLLGALYAQFSTHEDILNERWSYPPSWSTSICLMLQGMICIFICLSIIAHFHFSP
jgi:hypothetical protein